MSKRAIVTVGISDARIFGPYLDRWTRTFGQYGGADYMKVWHREWPPGSMTHRQCHYAFKVHAVWETYQRGYTSILWFDASCWATRPLGPLWERLERDGHVLVEDANKLGNWSSDASLAMFNVTRDEAMKIPLMCGTCWGVDLTNPRSLTFLERLRALAVPENFIGTHNSRHPGLRQHPRPGTEGAMVSNDERVWGHRSDEVWMSLLSHDLGMGTHAGVEFSGGGACDDRTCVRSGYNIDIGAGPDTYQEHATRKPRALEVFAEHTIDTALLSEGGYVLDAGCRNFSFARAMVARGCKVVALDADPTVEDPGIPGVAFFHFALADESGVRALIMDSNPEARRLAPAGAHIQAPTAEVQTVTLPQIMETLGIHEWDAVKLDIEGAEYGVLQSFPGGIARQISIEFHEHVEPRPQSVYDAIFEHLGKWYEVVQHAKERRYRTHPNFWDTLLSLK